MKRRSFLTHTGMAGIHESGTGYRMDDVPLPLTPVLLHPRPPADSLELLLRAIHQLTGAGR